MLHFRSCDKIISLKYLKIHCKLNWSFRLVQLMNELFRLKRMNHSQKNDSFKHLYSRKLLSRVTPNVKYVNSYRTIIIITTSIIYDKAVVWLQNI